MNGRGKVTQRLGIGALGLVLTLTMLFSVENSAVQATSAPTVAATASAGSVLQRITPDNANKLRLLTRIGYGFASAVDWSADGQWLAVGGVRGVWLYTASNLSVLPHLIATNVVVSQLAFSPDSTELVTVGDTVQMWDVASGKLLTSVKLSRNSSRRVAFRLNKHRIAFSTGSGGNVDVWDLSANRSIATVHSIDPYGPEPQEPDALALSPDGKTLATAWITGIVLWDVQSGKRLVTYDNSDCNVGGWTALIAFSPDGKRLVGHVGICPDSLVWDTASGKVLLTFHADFTEQFNFEEQFTITDLTFSPDGQNIVMAGQEHRRDNSNNVDLVLWDSNSGRQINTFRTPSTPGSTIDVLAFSPDGKQLVSVGGQPLGVMLWRLTTVQSPTVIQPPSAPLEGVAFSPDGQQVAAIGLWSTADFSSNQAVLVWNVSDGVQLFTLPVSANFNQAAIAYSTDSKELVTGDADGTVHVWDAVTGKALHSFKLSASITDVAFNPNGRQLAVVDVDDFVYLLDAQSGTESVRLHGGGKNVVLVAYSADGKQIATSDVSDSTLRLWDTTTGALVATLAGSDSLATASLAFSPDGKYLATVNYPNYVGGSGGQLALWDLARAKRWIIPQDQHDSVTDVAFSPDSQLLATSPDGFTGRNGEVSLWSVAKRTLRTTLTLLSGTAPCGVAFSPDGTRLAIAGCEGTVWVWGVPGGGQ